MNPQEITVTDERLLVGYDASVCVVDVELPVCHAESSERIRKVSSEVPVHDLAVPASFAGESRGVYCFGG